MAHTNKIISTIAIILLLGGVFYYSYYKKHKDNFLSLQVVNTYDLQGFWFTPHAALRNLTFFATDNKFNFNDGGGQIYTGTYSINDFSVFLHFEDKSQKDMALTFSRDNQQPNYYLKNDLLGEYYVKGDASQQVP